MGRHIMSGIALVGRRRQLPLCSTPPNKTAYFKFQEAAAVKAAVMNLPALPPDHERDFVSAIFDIGLRESSPKVLMSLMPRTAGTGLTTGMSSILRLSCKYFLFVVRKPLSPARPHHSPSYACRTERTLPSLLSLPPSPLSPPLSLCPPAY